MNLLKGLMAVAVMGGLSLGVSHLGEAQAAKATPRAVTGETAALVGVVAATAAHSDATPKASVPATPSSSQLAAVAPETAAPAPYVQPGEPPATLRRLKKSEVPVGLLGGTLHALLAANSSKPIGALVPVHFEGRDYVARIEVHYHPEGGPVRPWGNHRGVSLFVER